MPPGYHGAANGNLGASVQFPGPHERDEMGGAGPSGHFPSLIERSANFSNVLCPHCQRTFSDKAAQRHIPVCNYKDKAPPATKHPMGKPTPSRGNQRSPGPRSKGAPGGHHATASRTYQRSPNRQPGVEERKHNFKGPFMLSQHQQRPGTSYQVHAAAGTSQQPEYDGHIPNQLPASELDEMPYQKPPVQ